jgi:serine/threonine protein phosphatase PrpC
VPAAVLQGDETGDAAQAPPPDAALHQDATAQPDEPTEISRRLEHHPPQAHDTVQTSALPSALPIQDETPQDQDAPGPVPAAVLQGDETVDAAQVPPPDAVLPQDATAQPDEPTEISRRLEHHPPQAHDTVQTNALPIQNDTPHDPNAPQPVAPLETSPPALRPGEIPAEAVAVVPVPKRPPRIEILANARAGAPFSAHIVAHDEDRPARVIACEIPPEAAVRFEDGHLRAQSPCAGDYRIQVTVALGAEESHEIVRTQTTLVVNPDPRSLWRTIPSDRDAPGWKTDGAMTALDGAGGRRLLAASQRGRSHAHVGEARDDDFALRVTGPEGWNVLAVADGAGSAKRSRIGSRVACDTAVEVAVEQLTLTAAQWPAVYPANAPAEEATRVRNLAYQVLGTAAFKAVKAIEARGEQQGFAPRDYATTLLLALHRKQGDTDLVVSFWVGDGAIGVLQGEAGAHLLGRPDGGAYAGQTRFLDRDIVTDAQRIMDRIQVEVVPDLQALLLMSDGVSDPKFASDAALQDARSWQELWCELMPRLEHAQAPQQVLDWLGFWSTGNHDDRTLAVLW